MADVEKLLRRIFDEIVNEGRIDVADELFAEDFVDHGPMGDIHGRQPFKEAIAGWRAAVPDVHCEIDHVIEDGASRPGSSARRVRTPAVISASRRPTSGSKR